MRRLVFFGVFLLFAFCLEAQTSSVEIDGSSTFSKENKEFYLGWEAGINRSFLKNYYKNKSEKATKFKGGLFVNYRQNVTWSFQGDLIYEEKGGRSKGLDITYEFKYLALSFYPVFSFKNFHAFSGIYYSYLLKATDDVPENVIISGALKPEKFNKDDFGMKFGLGVRVLKNFNIDFCYDHGIASVYDYPLTSPSGHPRGETYWFRSKAYSITLKAYFKKARI